MFRLYFSIIVMLIAFNASSLRAADNEWLDANCTPGNYSNSACWSLGAPPTEADNAIFNLRSNTPYTISFDADTTAGFAIVKEDNLVWDLNGYSYTLDGRGGCHHNKIYLAILL